MRFLIAATIATLACTGVNAQFSQLTESETEVLKALATSTGGWETVSSGPWKVDTVSNACWAQTWYGIKCEKIEDYDRVVEISFPFQRIGKINGTISNIDFNKLPFLRRLYISETSLSGTLPNLSTHPTLKSLDVTNNPTLNGPITTSHIPPQLERIYVRGSTDAIFNQGALPSFDAVNATTLKSIGFQDAKVTGTLPSFERFINLEEIRMAGNTITGSVPRFGPSLRILSLLDNQFSVFDVSSIPVTVQELDLSNNKIVATFPDLSKLTDPRDISLAQNGFYGTVPLASIPAPTIGQNQTVPPGGPEDYYTYRFDIRSNSLTGALPPVTARWLQSRAPSNVTHKLVWYVDCNLFQTGLPELAPIINPFQCYDNKESRCANVCGDKLPGSTSGTGTGTGTPPPSSTGGKTNTTNAPPSTTTSPPTKPGPKNDATATATATSVFTGMFAVVAALVARF